MIKRARESSSPEPDSYPDLEGYESRPFNRTLVSPRGAYKYDFLMLSKHFPVLKKHMILNLRWKPFMSKTAMYHFDFNHPDAVYHLSKSILKHNHNLDLYMPCGCEEAEPCNMDKELELYNQYFRETRGSLDFVRFLAPCVPNRLSYIRAVATLLCPQTQDYGAMEELEESLLRDKTIKGSHVVVLDVGTGASCIYPLLGVKENSWTFIGSDIDGLALELAQKNVDLNDMRDRITLKLQHVQTLMFNNILNSHDFLALTVCNPPFHSSLDSTNVNPRTASTGREPELVFSLPENSVQVIEQLYMDFTKSVDAPVIGGSFKYMFSESDHGELAFIEIMLQESKFYCHNVLWFTSLVAKLSTLKKIKRIIQREMRQYFMSHSHQEHFLNSKLDRLHYHDLNFKFLPDADNKIDVSHIHICEFRTFTLKLGKQTRWSIAWTYYNSQQRTRIINNLSSIPTQPTRSL